MRKKQSIENRIALTLIGYTVFIVLLLWGFQVLFLNTYYQTMRRNSVIKSGSEIAQVVDSENFEDNIESICYQNRVSCIIFDQTGKQLYSVDMLGRGSFIHSQPPRKNAIEKVAAPVISGEKTEDVILFKDERFKNTTII